MRFPRSYDATISREDFLRLLPQAVGGDAWTVAGDRFVGDRWSLCLTRIAPLEIGSVRLDRHRVEVEFEGLSPAEEDAFMQRFTLHYQRGGG